MNKGKVRIYELSKELDLENKDILAICDQLEIAVKSHSSTISEEDASRIIAVAKANGYKPASKAIKPQPTRSNSASPPRAKPSIVQKPVLLASNRFWKSVAILVRRHRQRPLVRLTQLPL